MSDRIIVGHGNSGAREGGGGGSTLASAVAGAENLRRQMRRLRANGPALAALLRLGVGEPLIDRFSLGFKEPYAARATGVVTENALAFPIHARGGGPIGRFAYANVPGVTLNPGRPDYWGPGDCLPYYSAAAEAGDDLLVVRDPLTMWLAAGALAADAGRRVVVLTRSHFDGLPFDFSGATFWRPWGRVVLALDEDDHSAAMADAVLRSAGRDVLRATSGGEGRWASMLAHGASGHEIRQCMDRAKVAASPTAMPVSAEAAVGSFEADPVAVMGAFANGFMYYATRVERRHAGPLGGLSATAPVGDGVVQEYATVVVRSDGELLEAEVLPAPRGTPAHRRVMALSDGTRISAMPAPTVTSWSFASIQRFVADRRADREPAARPLARLVADLEAYVASVVWLPDADAGLLVALYSVMTHCYRVFDAVPLLLVQGERGSGKSELGQAMADLGFNAVLVGATTAAAIVRLIDETRGLLVLDDLEKVSGAVGGVGDVSQILKVSYKAATGRKAVADRSGRVVVHDFFGPKVITNIAGAHDVLRSRMLRVATRALAGGAPAKGVVGSDPTRSRPLRDELHVWAMANAATVGEGYRELLATSAVSDRHAEIAAPLRAIARIAGGDVSERLERVLGRQREDKVDPEAVLVRAVEAIVARGGGPEVTLAEIAMQAELALGGQEPPPDTVRSAEWVGRALVRLGVRDAERQPTRQRLRGRVVRIVSLDPDWLASRRPAGGDADPPSPLAFCAARACPGCAYADVCAARRA